MSWVDILIGFSLAVMVLVAIQEGVGRRRVEAELESTRETLKSSEDLRWKAIKAYGELVADRNHTTIAEDAS